MSPPRLSRLFSTAEKQFLLSQRPLLNDAVLNFLVVRRSMMMLVRVFFPCLWWANRSLESLGLSP